MDRIIKLEGYITKEIFKRDDFKIYGFSPTKEFRDQVILNKYGTISIIGKLPEMFPDILYKIEVEYTRKNNYDNYIVRKIYSLKENIDDQGTKTFLYAIISKKRANTLIKVYPDIIDRIINNKEVDLSKTKGIKDKTFKEIKKKVIENFKLMDLVSEYAEYDMTLSMMRKLYDTYESVELINKKMKTDPYECLCKLNRIGFKTADKKILKKFPEMVESQVRCNACIEYILKENEKEGNVWIKIEGLRYRIKKLAPECSKFIMNTLKNNTIYYITNDKRICFKKTYECEKEVSNILKNLIKNKPIKFNINYNQYAKVGDIKLTNTQLQALKNINENRISILAGVGGSGKSFSTKAIINMLDNLRLKYLLLSPTGKAAKVLSEYTNRKAFTIHRGLKYDPAKNGFSYNANHLLPYDVIIVDEFSMIDIFLLRSLLKAIDINNTRILFIGDPAQIPSVSVGNIAFDMLQSNKIPTTMLTEVFRYGEGGLSYVATQIRKGEIYLDSGYNNPQIFGENKDYLFFNTNQEYCFNYVKSIYNKLIKNGATKDEIMILSAFNKGEFGTIKINNMIQDLINPKSEDKQEISYKKDKQIITLREDDRVIQIKNNYHATLNNDLITTNKIDDFLEEETTVFNGDSGIIKCIKNNKVYVDINNEIIEYDYEDLDQLSLSYALSIHKSQGSSSKYVILLTPASHIYFLDRNLLYVAATRSKYKMYHVGTNYVINSALKKSENFNRNTFLKEMLENC